MSRGGGRPSPRFLFLRMKAEAGSWKLELGGCYDRGGAGVSDWSDIFDLIRTCEIDLKDAAFRTLVLQFGGDEALERMERETR